MGAAQIRHASSALVNGVLMGQTLVECGFFFFLNESTLAEMLQCIPRSEGFLQHGSMCVCVVQCESQAPSSFCVYIQEIRERGSMTCLPLTVTGKDKLTD